MRVGAPAAKTFAAAMALDLRKSWAIRAIFRLREFVLHSRPSAEIAAKALPDWARELGWGLLAEISGKQVIFGAVTKPWEANVTFRAVAPEQFAEFSEPGYVRIVWTVRVDALSETVSQVQTETRVVTTDSVARRRFRCYWPVFRPGIVVIRRIALALVKKEAER